MKRKQRSMNKLRTLHMHNHMRIWYKQVDKEIPRYNLRKLTFRALALRLRVVQYCDIMRFMILCDRHHKVSPDPNP